MGFPFINEGVGGIDFRSAWAEGILWRLGEERRKVWIG